MYQIMMGVGGRGELAAPIPASVGCVRTVNTLFFLSFRILRDTVLSFIYYDIDSHS